MKSNDKNKRVVMITSGKSGVGKSTLMNNFLRLEGNEVRITSLQPTSVTQNVDYYDKEINGVNVRVVDMPGLHAAEHDKDECAGILGELKAVTKGSADVVFFCVNLVGRLDKVDRDNIDTLTRAFGTEIWKHVIFTFTWADIALYNGYSLEELVDKFIEEIHKYLVRKWRMDIEIRSIYSFQSSTDMTSEDSEVNKFNGIVGIPVSKDPRIPPEWRINLLLQVIRKCKKENIPSLVQVSGVLWDEVLKALGFTVAGSIGGAAVGTAIGAGIGALAGGALTAPIGGVGAIPTAAGGAALGAWIGTLAGGGSIGLTSLAGRIAFVISTRYKIEKRARRRIKQMLEGEKSTSEEVASDAASP